MQLGVSLLLGVFLLFFGVYFLFFFLAFLFLLLCEYQYIRYGNRPRGVDRCHLGAAECLSLLFRRVSRVPNYYVWIRVQMVIANNDV